MRPDAEPTRAESGNCLVEATVRAAESDRDRFGLGKQLVDRLEQRFLVERFRQKRRSAKTQTFLNNGLICVA